MNTKEPRRTYYWWPERNRLVCLDESATPDFWDRIWQSDDWAKQVTSYRKGRYFRYILSKYLPNKTSIILEGGCGDGHLVDAMNHWGYRAVGVDFAAKTISEIKKVAPNLDVRCGDVRSLEFEDGYFDGYFSLGVIEHFWDGYADILSEMKRVLKAGGYAFVAVPSISRLERIMMFSMYRKFTGPERPDNFYQFALDATTLKEDFERIGLEYVRTWRTGDWNILLRFVPGLYSLILGLESLSKKCRMIRLFRSAVMVLMSPICGDNVLLVLRKK